ncbi:Bystin-domain-containing protein, partial [Pseudovirgaria hyperparasitica]
MPKASISLDQRQALRHNPLGEDYSPSSPLKQKKEKKRKQRSDVDDESFVDSRSSRKILQIGQELVDEESAERQTHTIEGPNPAFNLNSRDPGAEGETNPLQFDDDDDEVWADEEEEVVIQDEIDPTDLDVFNRFNPQNDDPLLGGGRSEGQDEQGTDLTALILEKIAAFEAGNDSPAQKREIIPPDAVEIPAKAVEAFTKVGMLLSRYKSGKLPKIFKVLPTLADWQTYVSITRPDEWTPNAMLAATKLFVSQKPEVVQEFLNWILLPRVRQDIYENAKANVHLYDAVKRSMYKPSAFFKGILFPMLTSAPTQKEARTMASIMSRVKIPVLHSAAALNRLCDIAADQMAVDLDSAGPTNICIKALLEKKYALPWAVVDALVFHFLRFKAADPTTGDGVEEMTGVRGPNGRKVMPQGKLPVIWHQCLLAFSERFKNDITEDQREALLDLLLAKGHSAIGPEIRRELLAGRGRGVIAEPQMGNGGDDTMLI